MTEPVPTEFSHLRTAIASTRNHLGALDPFFQADKENEIILAVGLFRKRGYGWLALVAAGVYFIRLSLSYVRQVRFIPFAIQGDTWRLYPLIILGLALIAAGLGIWLYSSFIKIPAKTTGIYSSFGKIQGTLDAGVRFLLKPWEQVEYIVDTSTEFPYTASALTYPTRDNVLLTAKNFFLKFRITDPIKFVRNTNAENLDLTLKSLIQDTIRRRIRQTSTETAYELRGDKETGICDQLNIYLANYGIRVLSINIPEVILPEQYRGYIAHKEWTVQEKAAYEAGWEFTRQCRIDALQREIEQAIKKRDEMKFKVQEAIQKAHQQTSLFLQQKRVEANKIYQDIIAAGCTNYYAAQKEARRLETLGEAYRENPELLEYELTMLRLQVAEELSRRAPRPLIINSHNEEGATLASLLLATLLPQVVTGNETGPIKTAANVQESGREP